LYIHQQNLTRNGIIRENPAVSFAQLVNNVPASCGTQSFLTMFTQQLMKDLIMNLINSVLRTVILKQEKL